MAGLQDFFGANLLQIIDILAVSVLFYYIFLYVRGTKTALVIQGMVLLGFVYFICQHFRLITLVFILEGILVVGPLALVLIFAPEIRQVFERVGRTSRWFSWLVVRDSESPAMTAAEIITDTVFELSNAGVGALFVITGDDPLDRYIVPGTELGAIPSERFLFSLFNRHNPLHDGAVIIEGDRVQSAGNFLPISESTFLDKQLGTRHRAAVGLTERCDAVVVVVSEETGDVSIAFHGRLSRRLNEEQFADQFNALVDPNPNFATIVPRASTI